MQLGLKPRSPYLSSELSLHLKVLGDIREPPALSENPTV